MQEIPSWVWLVAFAAVGGAAVLLGRRQERRRSAALEQAALRLGMNFLVQDEAFATSGFTGRLPLFQRGYGRGISNVARGSNESVFEFRYTVGSGKNSSTYQQTVAVFDLSPRELPAFELKPEGLTDKLGSLFGGQDINFEEDPEFSRRFRLRGPSEDAIRERFHTGLRQQLVAGGSWSVEGDGPWLAVYRRSKRVRPDDLMDFLQETRRLAGAFR